MTPVAQQRCFHHAQREAAARCVSCRRYYCRECATEHEGGMMCAQCVAELLGTSSETTRAPLSLTLLAVGGLLLVWMMVYYLGMALAHLPDSFHAGGVS